MTHQAIQMRVKYDVLFCPTSQVNRGGPPWFSWEAQQKLFQIQSKPWLAGEKAVAGLRSANDSYCVFTMDSCLIISHLHEGT